MELQKISNIDNKLKPFEIYDGNTLIGSVEQYQETQHKMSGTFAISSREVIRWSGRPARQGNRRLQFDFTSRKSAVEYVCGCPRN